MNEPSSGGGASGGSASQYPALYSLLKVEGFPDFLLTDEALGALTKQQLVEEGILRSFCSRQDAFDRLTAQPLGLTLAMASELLQRFCPPAAGPGAGIGSSAPDDDRLKVAMKQAMEEYGVQRSSPAVHELQFSAVGSQAAAQLYSVLQIAVEDGTLLDPLLGPPYPSCGFFDMSAYADEDSALPHFLEHIKAGLMLNGVNFNRGGFSIHDLHKQTLYNFQHSDTSFKGGMDAGIVPYGTSKVGCAWQLRAGVEVKHSEKHKAAYKEQHFGTPITGKEQDVHFISSVLGQSYVETLAAFAFAEVPSFALLLSSYDTNVVLELSAGTLRYWEGLDFDAAMFKMGAYLRGCNTERRYLLDSHRMELPAEAVEVTERLRKRLKGESLLAEQLRSLAGEFADDPRERLGATLELIQTHHAWPSSMYA